MALEIHVGTSIDAHISYSRDFANFNAYVASLEEQTPQRLGALASINAATAITSGVVSLLGGARNLKREEQAYRLEVNIKNCTTGLIGIVESDTHSAMTSTSHIMPSESGTVIFTEKVGSFQESIDNWNTRTSPTLYLQLISSDGHTQGIDIGISDESSHSSKTICVPFVKENGTNPSVTNPYLDNANSDLNSPIFYFTTAQNKTFSVKSMPISNDDSASITIEIVERVIPR
ncbi:hypothetical protein [Enterovibrio nigricans]|uniref:Uncharacterized protein n=1 Tax=Enterovibrio nigricans DSM 22720 TaxID=1121868 RepID=A0A1T4VP48_9GAMM|nr:hypothetical protein [Enterovibrio nigricans]PKF49454.1 hypothetical protein AT251_18705 [Enterovibrio nigricans]SKA66744.1 hypothetical protein SAMN02745132_04139 [Enterovibrio nigricans DSM 22720]